MIPHWNPKWVEVPITVTLDAYDANDVVGGTLSSDAVGQVKGGGYIHAVRLVDGATQAEAYKLWVFTSAPSTIADAAAHVPTEADLLKCVGVIDIPTTAYRTDGTEADAAFVKGYDELTEDYIFFDNLAANMLYFRLVAVATPDYAAAADLTMHVCLMLM